jgi:ribosomal protein S18 acetylase RimI-like enzyme
MNEAYIFLPAQEGDVPELNKLVNSAYRGDSSRQGWTTEADLLDGIRTDEQGLREQLAEPEATILKAIDSEGKLAGSVYLRKEASEMYLGMLTVAPNRQGGGLGKALMAAAEDYAIAKGCRLIKMTVITVRSELIQWYERRGYRTTEERAPFPDDPRFGIPKQPLEFLVMVKELQ